MIEVAERVFVGSLDDLENFMFLEDKRDFYILYCMKNPSHKEMVGYEGKSCDKDHPEYLMARRGQEMALNMVDAPRPEFFSQEMITAGLDFLEEGYLSDKKVVILCNKGQSRSCGMALLFLATRLKMLPKEFIYAEQEFKKLYPDCEFGKGIYQYMVQNWEWHRDNK